MLISIILNVQSIFFLAQKSNWYPEFLKPVVSEVMVTSNRITILDIGTGPGKLPELLIKSDSSLKISGIDIDTASIDEARRNFSHKNVDFQYQEINKPLKFKDNQFDIVTFCSVLFLVDDQTKEQLMDEAIRVLKPNGKIIILTPSGYKSRFSALLEVWKFPFSKHNWTYLIWKTVTTSGGRKWRKQKWLENFSTRNQLNYSSILAFNNNVTVEKIIINKKSK